MSGLYRGENEICIYGLRMYELMKEKMGKENDDKYIDNFVCYMLNRTEWLKLSGKWRLDSHKYEKPVSKGRDPLRFFPSWIGKVEDRDDSSNWHTEIFVNHLWLKRDRRDKCTQFLFSLSHELIHHFEYTDSYFEGKPVNYPQDSPEEMIRKYADPYMRKYPRDKKRFKNIMKQKEFRLIPTPFYK